MNRSNGKDDSGPCYLFSGRVFLLGGMKMVCRVILILITCALVMFDAEAQPQPPAIEWDHRYGCRLSDDATAILPTSDGGYLVCGNFLLPDFGLNMSVVKTNASGDSLWSRSYRTIDWEECMAAQSTPDGGFFLAGHTWTEHTIGLDFMLLKINAQGDSLWSRTYGCDLMDFCYAAQITPDGGCLLVGQTYNPSADTRHGWVVRTDANGDCLWNRTYGEANLDVLSDIVQTSDQNYVVAGTTQSFGGVNVRFWLMKINGDGDTLWNRTYGGPDLTGCRGVLQTADHGFILYGWELYASTHTDFWLVKTDSVGHFEWSKTYGGDSLDEECFTACQIPDGGFILAGDTRPLDLYDYDGWIVRTDADGDSLWSMRLGGVGHDGFNSILTTPDGGTILGGYVSVLEDSMSITTTDMWLVKLAPEMFVRDTPIPRSAYLLSSYPNPFNSTTQIKFALPVTQRVSLRLYDVLGREVAVLLDEIKIAGEHRVSFNGSGLSSGVYFCRMEAGATMRTQKIVLMR